MLSCPVLATPHPQPASCVFRLRAGRLPRLPRPCRGASQGAAYIAAASPMIGNFRVSPFHFPLPSKFFRMNTYESVSKQRTLTLFRMNTYKKQGGGAGLLLTRNPKKDFYPACPVPTMYKGKVTREIPPWNGGDLIDSRSGHFV